MSDAVSSADLSHVETWIFDLDNTLYPQRSGLFDLIDERMTAYIAAELKLDPIEAHRLQKSYFHSHGTTLSGLMAQHGFEPAAFLDYVHEIDLSRLVPDPALDHALGRLPGRCIVYTNGSQRHAERVLERLGIARHFAAIHDIAASGYCPKPHRVAYEGLIARHRIRPPRAAMFEDIARNLETPHALGMTTILVADAPSNAAHVHHTTQDLGGFLAKARIMPYERRRS
jgi:putative hydrolase of the HAD superfamily